MQKYILYNKARLLITQHKRKKKMYTPQFRFALLVCIFVVIGTIIEVLYTYAFGEKGLDFPVYFNGVMHIAVATTGGFFFIWICNKFITFNGLKVSAFQASFSDEYGTKFVFPYPIKLSKFLPDIIAKPYYTNISDIEAELIGFLSAYKEMPMDLYTKNSPSLYDYSLAIWKESKKIQNTNHLHHIACLSKHLGLVHTYKEKRKSAPMWQFWARDKVSYSKANLFHGGLSAFVLSTMPSFQKLDEEVKRLLLVSIRFSEKPAYIPVNCHKSAFHIYETMHKAEQRVKNKLQKTSDSDEVLDLTQEQIMQFKKEAKEFTIASLGDLNLSPETPITKSAGVYLGFGLVIVKIPYLLNIIAKQLSPQIRSELNLWDVTKQYNPVWPYLVEALKEINITHDQLEDDELVQDINSFVIDDVLVTNCLLLKIEQKSYPVLRGTLDKLPKFDTCASLEKDPEEIIKEIKTRSAKIDEFLATLYS